MTEKLHDVHAHLELLLQKTNLLKKGEREIDIENPNSVKEFNFEIRELERLLEKHEFIIQAGISTNNFLLVHKLFQKIEKIYYLIGSHPEIIDNKFNVKIYLEEQETILKYFLKDSKKNKIIGIGEIGLDYFYTEDEEIKDKQKHLFESQLDFATRNNLPIEIHTREAWDDTFDILKNHQKNISEKFLIHCFTGGVKELDKVLDLGGMVAFGGVSTFKNAKNVQEAFEACPKDRFVLETDLPFLAPSHLRGKTCLPEYIDYTAEFLTNLKTDLTKDNIWQKSRDNTKKLFGI